MPASSRFSSSPNPEVARLWRGRWSGVPYRYRSELVFWRAACYRQLFGAALPLQRGPRETRDMASVRRVRGVIDSQSEKSSSATNRENERPSSTRGITTQGP